MKLAHLILGSSFLVPVVLMAMQAEDRPNPDRWRGLVVGESTFANCTDVLGKASEDKPDRLFLHPVDKWFVPGLNGKVLRKASYRGVPGFKRVDLYFRSERLVVIQLAPEETIQPSALPGIYGVEFRPFVSGFLEGMSGDIERHKGEAYPRTYPSEYSLVASTPKAVLKANVSNSGIGAIMRKSMGAVDTAGGGFPGKVVLIQLISRQLENRAGSDLLK